MSFIDNISKRAREISAASARNYREEAQLYISHHQHPGNWWLHTVCVPIEWTAWLVILEALNLAKLFAGAIALYYLFLLPSRYRFLGAVGQWGCAIAAEWILIATHRIPPLFALPNASAGVANLLVTVAAMQTAAWFVQVCIGHHALERNRPSMSQSLTLNSVVLSLLLAWDADCNAQYLAAVHKH
jgi:uncharacterized membrane protein YGL010W